MPTRPRSLPAAAAALLLAACSYWYTVAASLPGPALQLDVEQPAHGFSVRACVEEATAEDLALSVVVRARSYDAPQAEPPLLGLTLAPPDGFGPAAQGEQALAGAAEERLSVSVHLDAIAIAAACSTGLRVEVERLDADLAGRVEIEWDVHASAGSASPEIQGADLRLEVQPDDE